MSWQCRWSPTLGELEDTHQKVWGTKDYKNQDDSTVFFGLYGLPDFYALWWHKGEKHILWAGTDILHFVNGYWLEDGGGINIPYPPLAEWINKNCSSWCENEVEQNTLSAYGIDAKICPSFLGNVKDYKSCYKPSKKPKVYSSVSGDDFMRYGWYKIDDIAFEFPKVEFHLYGNESEWNTKNKNVIVHGKVSKEQMNKEIKEMQGAIRMTDFDGFSEILAKSILWGQWPVSLIDYPFILGVNDLKHLYKRTQSNYDGREYYLKKLNQYPWNQQK